MVEAQQKKSIPERSAESNVLIMLLREVKEPGDVITYERMSSAIGRDVQHGARHFLDTARKVVLREDRKLFAAVRNEGLKLLTDSGIVDWTQTHVQHIARATRRTAKGGSCADYEGLTEVEKNRHNAQLGVLGGIRILTKRKTVEALQAAAKEAQHELPVAKVLDAVRRRMNGK